MEERLAIISKTINAHKKTGVVIFTTLVRQEFLRYDFCASVDITMKVSPGIQLGSKAGTLHTPPTPQEQCNVLQA